MHHHGDDYDDGGSVPMNHNNDFDAPMHQCTKVMRMMMVMMHQCTMVMIDVKRPDDDDERLHPGVAPW